MTDPNTTYNQISTSIIREGRRWAIVLTYGHSETGITHTEKSAMTFETEDEARRFATRLAHTMRDRIAE